MDLIRKQTYFNELAARWDQLPSPPDAAAKVARFARRCLGGPSARVLDVGCGTGILVQYMQAADAAPRQIVEMDLAEAMLRENRRKPGGGAAEHICGEAQRPPFRRETFDSVICFNALPHLTPIEATLLRMLECLRPGGLLSVGHLMASGELNRFHAAIGGAVAGDRLPAARELGRLLAGLGAEVMYAEEEPGWYFVQAIRR